MTVKELIEKLEALNDNNRCVELDCLSISGISSHRICIVNSAESTIGDIIFVLKEYIGKEAYWKHGSFKVTEDTDISIVDYYDEETLLTNYVFDLIFNPMDTF